MLSLGFEIKLSSWNAYCPANIINHIKDNHCFYYCKHRMRLEVKLPIIRSQFSQFRLAVQRYELSKGTFKKRSVPLK